MMASFGHFQIKIISLTSILFDNKQFGEKGSASVVYGLGFCHFKGIFDLKICAVPNSLCLSLKSF